MRADLIRLLVDTRRKELITHADTDGGIGSYSTLDRVALSKPLSEPKADVRGIKKVVPRTTMEGEGNGVLNGN